MSGRVLLVVLLVFMALTRTLSAADPEGAAAYVQSQYVQREYPSQDARYTPRIEALRAECEAWADANEEICIDFDKFIMAQDYELTDLKFETEADDGNTAKVKASFNNFGRPTVVVFDLIHGDQGWVIDEMTSGCQTLTGVLKRETPKC
jgi:hypothetical protein